jgi:hypothetical protein
MANRGFGKISANDFKTLLQSNTMTFGKLKLRGAIAKVEKAVILKVDFNNRCAIMDTD